MSTIEQRQRSHVAATYAVTRRYLAEIRQVALTGEGADGTRYTPLGEPQCERLVAALDRVVAELERLAAELVPAEASHDEACKGRGATRMWLSTLLYMVQEQIEDLEPGRLARRYGEVPEAQGRRMAEAATRALADLREAFGALD